MEVKQKQTAGKGCFFIEENEKEMAVMTYTVQNEMQFSIDHTVVDPSQGGKGLGKLLFLEAVKFAREHHYKIVPLCAYAASVFQKSDEYNDVLAN